MKPGGEPDTFSPDGLVMFQQQRRAELRRWASGDRTVEGPFIGVPAPRVPSYRPVPTPESGGGRVPYAGQEDED